MRHRKLTTTLIGLMAGLVCFAGSSAQAQAGTRMTSASTQVAISKYVHITATGAPFTISVTDGGAAGSYASNTVTITVTSNDAYTITSLAVGNSVSGYTGGPSGSTLKISTWTAPTLTAGTHTGTIAITLAGLSYSNATPTTTANVSGSITITVTAT